MAFPTSMLASTTLLSPLLAPLSQPMVHELTKTTPKTQIPLVTDLGKEFDRRSLEHISMNIYLQQQVESRRDHAYALVKKAIEDNELNTRWLIEQVSYFSQKKKNLSPETFSRWRDLGLLTYQKENTPDSDSAAALLTLRLLSSKQNAWMPRPTDSTNFFRNEPLWWCWRQDTPNSPVIPCPIPLPPDVPPHALLWTDWLGAEWKPLWLKLGRLGCCRWAGTNTRDGKIMWDIDEHGLQIWGTEITAAYRKALDNDAPITRHVLAQHTLLELATEKLETLQLYRKAPQTFLKARLEKEPSYIS